MSSISYLQVLVHHLQRASGNYVQDISTEAHLENIHQKKIQISTSTFVCMCVRVRMPVHVRAEGCAPSESSVVQPSAVISLIIFNGHSFM